MKKTKETKAKFPMPFKLTMLGIWLSLVIVGTIMSVNAVAEFFAPGLGRALYFGIMGIAFWSYGFFQIKKLARL